MSALTQEEREQLIRAQILPDYSGRFRLTEQEMLADLYRRQDDFDSAWKSGVAFGAVVTLAAVAGVVLFFLALAGRA